MSTESFDEFVEELEQDPEFKKRLDEERVRIARELAEERKFERLREEQRARAMRQANQSRHRSAWMSAIATARRRIDYRVERVDYLGEGETIRLVPSELYRVRIELAEPLDVMRTEEFFGLVSLYVRPHRALVDHCVEGTPLPDEVHVVVYDADYPVLVRG